MSERESAIPAWGLMGKEVRASLEPGQGIGVLHNLWTQTKAQPQPRRAESAHICVPNKTIMPLMGGVGGCHQPESNRAAT